jgi:TetR/AcrR family tetracycline transcriptional repressor
MERSVRRGRPPRISREVIVATARAMDPAAITMQAVADALGVDRKALNYHVTDREGLLQLVAADSFAAAMEQVDLSHGGDWRDALRGLAQAMLSSLVATGALAPYVQSPLIGGTPVLVPIERVLATLVDAGFGLADAGRILGLVAEVVHSVARDTLLTRDRPVHPQVTELLDVLGGDGGDQLPLLRQLLDAAVEDAAGDAGPTEQLAFDLDVIIDGLAQRLAGRG